MGKATCVRHDSRLEQQRRRLQDSVDAQRRLNSELLCGPKRASRQSSRSRGAALQSWVEKGQQERLATCGQYLDERAAMRCKRAEHCFDALARLGSDRFAS